MMVVVFRARARAGMERKLAALGARMYELASAMPGFISYKDYLARDGEGVSVIEFHDAQTMRAWREHPEHVLVQQRAREELLSSFRIQVCEQLRVSEFAAPE